MRIPQIPAATTTLMPISVDPALTAAGEPKARPHLSVLFFVELQDKAMMWLLRLHRHFFRKQIHTGSTTDAVAIEKVAIPAAAVKGQQNQTSLLRVPGSSK